MASFDPEPMDLAATSKPAPKLVEADPKTPADDTPPMVETNSTSVASNGALILPQQSLSTTPLRIASSPETTLRSPPSILAPTAYSTNQVPTTEPDPKPSWQIILLHTLAKGIFVLGLILILLAFLWYLLRRKHKTTPAPEVGTF